MSGRQVFSGTLFLFCSVVFRANLGMRGERRERERQRENNAGAVQDCGSQHGERESLYHSPGIEAGGWDRIPSGAQKAEHLLVIPGQ